MIAAPDRNHGIILKCCSGLDTLNGKMESGSPATLTLQTSQELMNVCDQCQSDVLSACGSKPVSDLEAALQDFRDLLFGIVQKGFASRETELKTNIVNLINKCLQLASTHESWTTLRTQIEDYQRLATAEVFSVDEQKHIKVFGEAAYLFHRYGFHCH